MSTFEGLYQLILPPEDGGENPKRMALLLESYLSMAPGNLYSLVKQGAFLINAISRIYFKKNLNELSYDERQQLLNRLTRLNLSAALLEGVKALCLLVYGAATHSEEIISRANLNPVSNPTPELDITEGLDWPSYSTCDAIVIGSGAGGAMAARTLVKKGLEVVIVEEGDYYTADFFRSADPLERFSKLYRDAGTTTCLGLPPIVMPIGRGVGGTTLVNSGTCYKTPERVLKKWHSQWGVDFCEPKAFEQYLEDAFNTFKVGPVPFEVMGQNGKTVIKGATNLGWQTGPLLRNAPGCDGCCQCSIGCPHNAKYGVHLNALPVACQYGAKIITNLKVDRILTADSKALGVSAVRKDGSTVILLAPITILAAGTTESPLILRRSGLGKHPEIGKNMAIHPAVALAGRFKEEIYSWMGVLQSAHVSEFHDSDGILLEATSTPPGMGSMVLPGFGRDLLNEIEQSKYLATCGAMVADKPRGRVVGTKHATLIYQIAKDDARRLIKSILIMGRVMFSAGAYEVLSGIPSAHPVRTIQELEDALSKAKIRDLHIAAFHPTGTLRAGKDDQKCPVEPTGRLRGIEGLYVTDGSVLPTCPEVNPQISIMAFSLAVADNINL
jgi:choline dehydrogenase-like flavoprotein